MEQQTEEEVNQPVNLVLLLQPSETLMTDEIRLIRHWMCLCVELRHSVFFFYLIKNLSS